MRKLWKCRKALSPVIAAIILIAVTVAVSIAVAVWMGTLSFSFMGTEQIGFTGISWDTGLTYANLKVKNQGTAVVTIDKIKVNSIENTTAGWSVTTTGADRTLDPNEEVTIKILASGYYTSGVFIRGGSYAFVVVTSKNNPFGPYTANAGM